MLDEEGNLVPGAGVPEISKEEGLAMWVSISTIEGKLIGRYRTMTLIPILDNVLYQSQRQGRISFYMQSAGEEAAIIGSAAALMPTDEIFGQYVSLPRQTVLTRQREGGALLYRGFTLQNLMAQCFSNAEDLGTKGRMMPIHYSSPEHGFHTITSPLATQYDLELFPGYS